MVFSILGARCFFAITRNATILENADLLNALLNRTLNSELYTITIINTIAGYGPLLGTILIYIFRPETRE